MPSCWLIVVLVAIFCTDSVQKHLTKYYLGKTNEDSTSNSSFLLPELEAIEVAIDGIKNRQCRIDSQLVLASAKRKETWAMQSKSDFFAVRLI